MSGPLFIEPLFRSVLGRQEELCWSHSSDRPTLFEWVSLECSVDMFDPTPSRSITVGQDGGTSRSRLLYFDVLLVDYRRFTLEQTNSSSRRKWVQRLSLLERDSLSQLFDWRRARRTKSIGPNRESLPTIETISHRWCSSEFVRQIEILLDFFESNIRSENFAHGTPWFLSESYRTIVFEWSWNRHCSSRCFYVSCCRSNDWPSTLESNSRSPQEILRRSSSKRSAECHRSEENKRLFL